MIGVRVHRPTVRGRLRIDRGLLVLIGLVVALASALLAAVWPLTVRTADEAMTESVRGAGAGASVVATLPPRTFRGERVRDADALERFALDVEFTRNELPEGLASVVHPSTASLVSESLSVTGPGPAQDLRLAYVEAPTEPPAVTWVAGGAPQSSAGPGEEDIVLSDKDPPWPVQVGLSERVAAALGLDPGARLVLEDQYGYDVVALVTGIYSPDDPQDPAWAVARGCSARRSAPSTRSSTPMRRRWSRRTRCPTCGWPSPPTSWPNASPSCPTRSESAGSRRRTCGATCST